MNRRALLAAGGAWLATAAARSFSQTLKLPHRIAFLHPGTKQGNQLVFDAFRTALKDLGYVDGRDISVEPRWAEGRTDRLPSLAAELVALDPAVIVTGTSAAIAACRKATSKIPIVFATAVNPVEQGFVSSLRRPGGNVTGIMLHLGLAAKTAELSNSHDITMDGGLMSYGTAREENYRRAAALMDKILRGAKPGDLPVEQPERFQLVVNAKTAKAIGITLSPLTMLRADRVIE